MSLRGIRITCSRCTILYTVQFIIYRLYYNIIRYTDVCIINNTAVETIDVVNFRPQQYIIIMFDPFDKISR